VTIGPHIAATPAMPQELGLFEAKSDTPSGIETTTQLTTMAPRNHGRDAA
jgi:hypothetical protein